MSLEESVRWAYSGGEYIRSRQLYGVECVSCDNAYMEIPLTFPVFEMPAFVLRDFDAVLENYDNQEVVVVKMHGGNKSSRYTTVNRAMQDVIISGYRRYALMTVPVKQGDEEIYYFATNGAIFDKHLNVLAMCSWLVEMFEDRVDGGWSFRLVRPLLRVSPQCYIEKSNPMEKMIVNKMIPAVLTDIVRLPTTSFIDVDRYSIPRAKVEICDSPFNIRRPDVPSISTTNDELVATAAEYINEVI